MFDVVEAVHLFVEDVDYECFEVEEYLCEVAMVFGL